MPQSKDKISEIDDHITKRFEIQKRLGKGAYGIVWKAMDKKTKEVVAVKKIFDAFRNQTDAQRTFREIMFLQSFKHHPNIVKLHSIHRAANNRDIYLGFEYMETDLHNVIKRGNILKDVHKRYIMYQLFKATKYIHSGNVIHRDQKPSNVLLDTLCRCKIADFGLARSLSSPPLSTTPTPSPDSDPLLTDYVATRWYRAPEILIANRRYTKGIDMWSLGCILGEMLAGKPIFPGTSTVNQVEKIMATIPYPNNEDINTVCVSGIGSSMIRNAAVQPHVPLTSLLDSETPNDALELINELLVFNPLNRLTADDALSHHYVAKFHDPSTEPTMTASVIIPINDDIRVSVDDYRNKLYELMATHQHQSSTINHSSNTSMGTSASSGYGSNHTTNAIARQRCHRQSVGLNCQLGERERERNAAGGREARRCGGGGYVMPTAGEVITDGVKDKQRGQGHVKDHLIMGRNANRLLIDNRGSKYHSTYSSKEVKSEPKLSRNYNPSMPPPKIRSDSKIPYHPAQVLTTNLQHFYTNENWRTTNPKQITTTKQKPNNAHCLKRPNPNKSNVYMSFNSYNQTHGIITQSALMELRAAGIK